MKFTEIKTVEQEQPLNESTTTVSADIGAIPGICKKDEGYDEMAEDIKGMKETNPGLYNKIINWD